MCRDERDCLPAVLDGVELVGTVGPSALAAVGSTDPGPAGRGGVRVRTAAAAGLHG